VAQDFPFPVLPLSNDRLPFANPPGGGGKVVGIASSGKKALDLFSGSGSVAKRLTELGYEVVTLDINPRCRPTIVVDILRWQYRKKFHPGYFDLVVASPPCEMYSQARTTSPRDFDRPDKIVKKNTRNYSLPSTSEVVD
jgi:hypothetical protein